MTRARTHSAATAALLTALAATTALTTAPAHAVTGDTAPAGSYGFIAKLTVGADEAARSCTGTLVAAQWLLTAASCFATDPQNPTVAAGKPALRTTAVIGRTDLTGTTGQSGEVVELVPRAGRDLVLARLARPTTGLAPVTFATTAAAAGEQLRAAGFGRTRTEWVPNALHTAAFKVDATGADDVAITGATAAAALCKGDTGGPLLREVNGKPELVGVNSRSWQGGCFGEPATETRNGAVASRADDLKAWVTTTVNAARPTDFNCDGVRDIAVADPDASVGADAKAGLVRIVYGGTGTAPAEITQDLPEIPGGSEPNDRFGAALAAFDRNLDGCTDLAVGIPGEDLDDATDAGMVNVLYGARGGLTKGQATSNFQQGSGEGAIKAAVGESGDQMGYALAAGTATNGDPYLAIGVPGEDIDTTADAGNAFYLRASANVSLNQGKTGVPGTPEAGDRFGAAIAGSPAHLVVGSPSEKIGAKATAGGLVVFKHALSAAGIPTPTAGLDQDSDIVTGAAEAGDQFGASLAMVPYRPNASSTGSDSILVVGSPGEDSAGGVKDAGRATSFTIDAAGKPVELNDIHQGTPDISASHEESDAWGKALVAVNTEPGAVSTTKNMFLAIGIPGEDVGTVKDAGSIRAMPLLGAPGAADTVVEPGKRGMPGVSGANQHVGAYLTATGSHLYVGMPDGPTAHGAVHALPWSNVLTSALDTVVSYQPGTGGLPAAGAAFGAASQ